MKDSVIIEAIAMRKRAVAPYSNYTVGAAVLTESGEVIGGCNVESSSYGLTCCAERIAIYNALSAGHKKFTALAVATDNGGKPCGACRQVIWDICDDIKYILLMEMEISLKQPVLIYYPMRSARVCFHDQ